MGTSLWKQFGDEMYHGKVEFVHLLKGTAEPLYHVVRTGTLGKEDDLQHICPQYAYCMYIRILGRLKHLKRRPTLCIACERFFERETDFCVKHCCMDIVRILSLNMLKTPYRATWSISDSISMVEGFFFCRISTGALHAIASAVNVPISGALLVSGLS